MCEGGAEALLANTVDEQCTMNPRVGYRLKSWRRDTPGKAAGAQITQSCHGEGSDETSRFGMSSPIVAAQPTVSPSYNMASKGTPKV